MNVTTTAALPGATIATSPSRERIRAHFRTRSDEGQSLLESARALILLVVVTGIITFGLPNNYL